MRFLLVVLILVVAGCAEPETPAQRAAREREEAREAAKQEHLDRINRKAERMDERARQQLQRQVDEMND